MRKLYVTMIGVRSHYAIPRILSSMGRLEMLILDFIWDGDGKCSKLIPSSILRRLNNRKITKDLRGKVRSINIVGVIYAAIISIIGRSDSIVEIVHYLYGKLFKIIMALIIPKNSTIYAYEGGVSKRQGDYLILEQTIAPYRSQKRLITKELRLWPELLKISSLKKLSWWMHIKREESDWILADKIVCPSEFVKDELINCGVDRGKIEIIEYGVNLDEMPSPTLRVKSENEKLKIIFVGDLSIRKGAINIIQCAKFYADKGVEFDICGNVNIPDVLLPDCELYLNLNGRLNWDELCEKMKKSNIFFLPSLVEGSAMSIIEASSSGLPVICTYSSGSRITDGVDGFIMKDNSVQSAICCIDQYLKQPDLIRQHSMNAISLSDNLGNNYYQDKINNLIKSIDLDVK